MGMEGMKKLYSTLIILVFTLVHLRGVDFGAIVQNYLTLLKVLLVVGLVLFGFILGKGDFSHLDFSAPLMSEEVSWKT